MIWSTNLGQRRDLHNWVWPSECVGVLGGGVQCDAWCGVGQHWEIWLELLINYRSVALIPFYQYFKLGLLITVQNDMSHFSTFAGLWYRHKDYINTFD